MGFAVFPLRTGGSALVDAAQVCGIQVDPPTSVDAPYAGQARLFITGLLEPFYCQEDGNTVYGRIADARTKPGIVFPPS